MGTGSLYTLFCHGANEPGRPVGNREWVFLLFLSFLSFLPKRWPIPVGTAGSPAERPRTKPARIGKRQRGWFCRPHRPADVSRPRINRVLTSARLLLRRVVPSVAPRLLPRHLAAGPCWLPHWARTRRPRHGIGGAPHDGCCTRCRGESRCPRCVSAETPVLPAASLLPCPPAPLRFSSCVDLADRRAAETPLSASGPPAGDVRDSWPACPILPTSIFPAAGPALITSRGRARCTAETRGRHLPACTPGYVPPAAEKFSFRRPVSPVGHCLPAIWPGAGIGREPHRASLSLLFFFPFGCSSAVVAM